MDAERIQEPSQPPPLSVVVTQLPAAPSKPLFRDATRLLSLAAFLFSVITGGFAVYQTWTTSRDTTIDNVNKIIEQYYAGQEKIAKLDPQAQLSYVNLVKSQNRSMAARAVALAKRVQNAIDDGTWLALAQINDAENFLAEAELSWSTAIKNTNEMFVYVYAYRGLAGTQLRMQKNDEAAKTIDLVLSSLESNLVGPKNFANPYQPYVRAIEAASTHAFWLSQKMAQNSSDCAILIKHFDAASASLKQASNVSLPYDAGYQNTLLFTRTLLNFYRNSRASCGPVDRKIEAEDNCYLLANILDNAITGFNFYKGVPDEEDFKSRVSLPETVYCKITSRSGLRCKFPENTESSTKDRAEKLSKTVAGCSKQFDASVRTDPPHDTPNRSIQTTTITSSKGPVILVDRIFWKPTANRAAGWDVMMTIEAYGL
jgi:hypothetical protein